MERIKELREARGITQAELAKMMSVSRPAVANWERGHSNPKVNVLDKLAEALGCTVGDFYASNSQENKHKPA